MTLPRVAQIEYQRMAKIPSAETPPEKDLPTCHRANALESTQVKWEPKDALAQYQMEEEVLARVEIVVVICWAKRSGGIRRKVWRSIGSPWGRGRGLD